MKLKFYKSDANPCDFIDFCGYSLYNIYYSVMKGGSRVMLWWEPDLQKNNPDVQNLQKKQNKRRRGRWSDLDDFTKAPDGSYIYIGVTYTFQGTPRERRKQLAALVGLAAAMLAAAVASGCVSAPGTGRCVYVVLPYCLCLLSTCSLAWGLGRLIAGGDPLRNYVYKATVRQFPLRCVLTVLGAAATLIGEAVYLILHGAGDLVFGASFFLFCHGLVLAGALLFRRLSRAMQWTGSEEDR